jgi:hypothetical protein
MHISSKEADGIMLQNRMIQKRRTDKLLRKRADPTYNRFQVRGVGRSLTLRYGVRVSE